MRSIGPLTLMLPAVLWGLTAVSFAAAVDEAGPPATPANVPAGGRPAEGIVRLTKDYDLWFDPKRKLVIVDGQVCLREGQLEMFACPKGTKEHESIVAVNCKAQWIHAALELAGAKAGEPVSFVPVYRAATGPVVDVYLLWKDEQGREHKTRAQEWVKEAKIGKAMTQSWVFAGSDFWTDEQTGQKHYSADGGDLICVSNFTTAMLDLPIPSSQSNEGLLFTAFTERIPPLGTKVRLVLVPRLKKDSDSPPAEAKPAGESP